MPLPDLADAIVSSGRDTLERAIHMVDSHPQWNAKVRV
jgi:DNA polymerase zeta